MNKLLYGLEAQKYRKIINNINLLADKFNFEPVYLATILSKDTFTRSMMYSEIIMMNQTFELNHNNNYILRPEGTAPLVEWLINDGKLRHNNQLRLFYCGNMFRHERAQKARYPEFTQAGFEILGGDQLQQELEILTIFQNFLQELKLEDKIILEINSIGNLKERKNYLKDLNYYISKHLNNGSLILTSSELITLQRNPLRLLDSKNPNLIEFFKEGPKILNYQDPSHYQNLCNYLKTNNFNFREQPNLVRGLDYYSDIVFEWQDLTDSLGSSNTVSAGGRYDSLLANQPKVHPELKTAFGFAIGIERLLMVLANNFNPTNHPYDYYLCGASQQDWIEAFKIRNNLIADNYTVFINYNLRSLKYHQNKARHQAKSGFIIKDKMVIPL